MQDPRTKVRRADRQVEAPEKIQSLLEAGQVGFIATSVNDQPYINSNLYWYDRQSDRVYFHTAKEGRTRTNIQANPSVCFSIGDMGRLLPADTALEFSVEYSGVVIFGKGRVVDDPAEAGYVCKDYWTSIFPNSSQVKIIALLQKMNLSARQYLPLISKAGAENRNRYE